MKKKKRIASFEAVGVDPTWREMKKVNTGHLSSLPIKRPGLFEHRPSKQMF